jgi:hypothetical protein
MSACFFAKLVRMYTTAAAIWEILGIKALFRNKYVTNDEMGSQHIDVLGPMPTSCWERWKEPGEFFDPSIYARKWVLFLHTSLHYTAFITASQLHDNRFNHSGFDPTPGIGTSEDHHHPMSIS